MASPLARSEFQPTPADAVSLPDALAHVWSELVRLCEGASAPFVPAAAAEQAWEEFAKRLRRALARESAVLPELVAEVGLRDDRARLRHGHGQLLAALDEAARLRALGKLELFVDVMQDLMTRMVAHDVWQRRCVAPQLHRRLPPQRRALAAIQLIADAANDH
jgi:hypothetical protein